MPVTIKVKHAGFILAPRVI